MNSIETKGYEERSWPTSLMTMRDLTLKWGANSMITYAFLKYISSDIYQQQPQYVDEDYLPFDQVPLPLQHGDDGLL
ncbi:hypothetical protein GCM10007162_16560 [Ignatzschineria ureiclastica]|nr:hypothetical protein GCM10007162_16560 [Ignatzschineria ureiclastica]